MVGITAAACSSSQQGSSAHKHSPTTRASGSGAQGPAAAAAGSTSGQQPCDSTGLSLAPGPGRAAVGTVVATYTLTNNASSLCHMTGYPIVRFLGPGGAAIAAHVTDGGTFFTNSKPVTVVLRPGGVASFLLTYSSAAGPASGCSPAQALSVTPPGFRGALEAPASLTVCPGSRFSVSPVVAGAAPTG